jgi:uncharacterized protein YggE
VEELKLPENAIVVSGYAERRVDPDVCRVAAAVSEHAGTERQAYDRCATRSNELVEALRAAAGEEGRVSAPGVLVTARWDYKKSRQAGFDAVSEVRVRAPVDSAGPIGQAAMEAGADRLGRFAFEVSDLQTRREELLADAVAAARRKAERLAAAAGRELGAVTAIVEDAAGAGEPMPFLAAAAAAAPRAAGAAPAPEPDVAAPDQTIRASVTVSFDLAG